MKETLEAKVIILPSDLFIVSDKCIWYLTCEVLREITKIEKKKSGVALTQLSLTLHYSKRIFY